MTCDRPGAQRLELASCPAMRRIEAESEEQWPECSELRLQRLTPQNPPRMLEAVATESHTGTPHTLRVLSEQKRVVGAGQQLT